MEQTPQEIQDLSLQDVCTDLVSLKSSPVCLNLCTCGPVLYSSPPFKFPQWNWLTPHWRKFDKQLNSLCQLPQPLVGLSRFSSVCWIPLEPQTLRLHKPSTQRKIAHVSRYQAVLHTSRSDLWCPPPPGWIFEEGPQSTPIQ